MDAFPNEDKGLFTFYREQADYQDLLRFQKHAIKSRLPDRKEEKPRATHLPPNEIAAPKQSREGFRKLSHNQPSMREAAQKGEKREQIIDEIKQQPDKIIQLLEKHKYARKKKTSLKVIMKSGESAAEANSEALKAHLEELMRSERQSRSISHIQKQGRNQETMNRLGTNESRLGKLDPFHKLALLPTSFDNHLDPAAKQSSETINPGKIIFLNNLKHKLPQKINRLKFNLPGEAPPIKNLPRIELRANNTEVMKKLEKIIDSTSKWDIKLSARWKNPVRQPEETYLKPIESERKKYKKDYSLNVQCFGLTKQTEFDRKSAERGHFLVFAGGLETTQAEQRHQEQKDRLLVQIVKKLKFQ